MIRQPHLYDDQTATVRSTQLRLFDTSGPADCELTCAECGRPLVRTDSGYLACPRGHGRLMREAVLDTPELPDTFDFDPMTDL